MDPLILISIFLLLIIVGAIFYPLSNEGFEEGEDAGEDAKPTSLNDGWVKVSNDNMETPYVIPPINNVDDYEYSLVFKNEGDKAITKETRDILMSRYPMDWSTQPPSSAKFQQGLINFKESFINPSKILYSKPPKNAYSEVDGTNMIPPDSYNEDKIEKEILATYIPKNPESLTTYDAEDAKELIDRIYDIKGQVAMYSETAPNQFTIYQVMPKDEDASGSAIASTEAVEEAGEDTIVIPPVSDNHDPFFTPGPKARDGRWDYTQWTPGLERMFAPNAPMKNWY